MKDTRGGQKRGRKKERDSEMDALIPGCETKRDERERASERERLMTLVTDIRIGARY